MPKSKRLGTADCVSLRSLYNNFLQSATNLIGKTCAKFDAQNLAEKVSVELNGAKNIITLQTKANCGFWFSGLPRQKGNKSNVIEACLCLVQVIGPPEKSKNYQLLNSNVHVSYFEQRRPGKCKILESWHYDFAPATAGHPVFHAQLTQDHMPAPSSTLPYKPGGRILTLQDLPRVPTPPLDLASVMELIVADHLTEFHAIVDSDDWKKTAASLPQFPMTHLMSWKLPSIDKLRSRHWYPAS